MAKVHRCGDSWVLHRNVGTATAPPDQMWGMSRQKMDLTEFNGMAKPTQTFYLARIGGFDFDWLGLSC